MGKASPQLIQAVAVTAELCGRAFSPQAAAVFLDDLASFPEEQILPALARCRKEVRGVLTLQDVLSRIDDGRPGPDTAWGMIPHDEAGSVVWTEEMRLSWHVASRLLAEGDRVAARMAFKETYVQLVQKARDAGVPVCWSPSLGHDPYGREAVLLEALSQKRLPSKFVQEQLGHREIPSEALAIAGPVVKALLAHSRAK